MKSEITKLMLRLEKLKKKTNKQTIKLKFTNISAEIKTEDEIKQLIDTIENVVKQHGFSITATEYTTYS